MSGNEKAAGFPRSGSDRFESKTRRTQLEQIRSAIHP